MESKGIEFDFEDEFASCAADLGCGNAPKTAIVVKRAFSDIDSDIATVFQTGNAAWTPPLGLPASFPAVAGAFAKEAGEERKLHRASLSNRNS